MFEEAAMMNYLMKDKAGEILIQDHAGFYAGTVDLSNPEAFQWYSEEVLGRNMLDFGISGWMVDFAEYIPTHAANNLGMDAETFHNIFPDIWAKCNFEALMSREKLHDSLTFQRSGTLGSSVFQQMMWAGDQNVNYEPADGLPSVITAALSGAVSGLTRTHSDIGGYTSFFIALQRDTELLMRWAEHAVFSPVMRTHEALSGAVSGLTRTHSDIGGYTSFFIALQRDTELLMRWAEHAVFSPVMRTHEGSSPEANEQIYSDPAILSGFARLVNLYVTLSPYTKAVLSDSFSKGYPVMRPLFFEYEDDPIAYEQQYQYLLGPDLLVAPVLQKDAATWEVYLPPDEWRHIWNPEKVHKGGGFIIVEAPVGKPPVFFRDKSSWKPLFEELGRL
ncbi:unnamed protein product [Notodromas monacha]|uniref:Alpha-glucosidase n=1 Tax=Notodromas monacha TaxID=399045 RepID=A0A7R9GFF0_9CRUS|nr:unnamed protein product [Notodromas monacha]CAG0920727.1 unnamed protein product [Notodromas monacha]